MTIYTKIQLW